MTPPFTKKSILQPEVYYGFDYGFKTCDCQYETGHSYACPLFKFTPAPFSKGDPHEEDQASPPDPKPTPTDG